MSIQNIEKLLERLNEFEAKRLAIIRDPNLSFDGREKALQTLAKQKADFKPELYSAFVSEWSVLWREARQLKERQALADEKAGAAWDYHRLHFCALQVENAVKAPVDDPVNGKTALGELEKAADQAFRSGDKYLRRAWSEFAPPAIRERFGAPGEALAARIAAEIDPLLETSEIVEIRRVGTDFAERSLRLIEITKRASQLYLEDPQFKLNSDILALLAGVEIESTLDAEHGMIRRSVDFVELSMHPAIAKEVSTLPGTVVS